MMERLSEAALAMVACLLMQETGMVEWQLAWVMELKNHTQA